MARFTFKLPDIGEGIAEAEIVAWQVAVGDRVEEDQHIADLMTDKATVEMESPVAGTVVELAGAVGDQVAIGSPLIVVETAELELAGAPAGKAVEAVEVEDPGPKGGASVDRPLQTVEPTTLPSEVGIPASREKPAAKFLASPAVRQRARELGIDLALIRPSEDGRIRHADLDSYLRYSSAQGYHVPGRQAARADEEVRVLGLRAASPTIWRLPKRHIPHFTYVEEIDVTELERVRADLNANRGERPKLTLLPLLIAAICKTIPQYPMLNARYDDEAGVVRRSGAIHLGMATQTDAGLMVPVIRDAGDKNIWQLAGEIARLSAAARSGKATVQELSGSTLTVTSLGPLGGIATTPVINRPEVAIIGPNKVIERPVFRGDEIVRAKLMNLSISCDHRVVDGWDAASFVQALKKLIETPVLLFAPTEEGAFRVFQACSCFSSASRTR